MTAERCDVVVIGAGIHGVGAAQAAAARGHSVLVLEQSGIASGTSSRSSKLIHGGLRYLEYAQFSLVHECLHERTLLLRLAPELVRLQPFHIPVYRETQRRPWQLRIGLALYALLAGPRGAGRFGAVPRRAWDRLDGLETAGLQRVFRYFDAQTDDAALTRAVMDSASALGARLEMPAEFFAAELNGAGAVVHYRSAGQERSCAARVLVNAAGPWVNRVLERITPAPPRQKIDLVQGAHLVVAGRLTQGIYYLEAPRDRRAVFAMPWREHLLLGTTETPFSGDPGAVAPLPAERDYLLETLTRYFPAFRARPPEVLDAFAGLRVLPSGGGSAFSRPRETILQLDRAARPRLVSIYGGKLTAYRATADKVLRRLSASLPARRAVADTRRLALAPR